MRSRSIKGQLAQGHQLGGGGKKNNKTKNKNDVTNELTSKNECVICSSKTGSLMVVTHWYTKFTTRLLLATTNSLSCVGDSIR